MWGGLLEGWAGLMDWQTNGIAGWEELKKELELGWCHAWGIYGCAPFAYDLHIGFLVWDLWTHY